MFVVGNDHVATHVTVLTPVDAMASALAMLEEMSKRRSKHVIFDPNEIRELEDRQTVVGPDGVKYVIWDSPDSRRKDEELLAMLRSSAYVQASNESIDALAGACLPYGYGPGWTDAL